MAAKEALVDTPVRARVCACSITDFATADSSNAAAPSEESSDDSSIDGVMTLRQEQN